MDWLSSIALSWLLILFSLSPKIKPKITLISFKTGLSQSSHSRELQKISWHFLHNYSRYFQRPLSLLLFIFLRSQMHRNFHIFIYLFFFMENMCRDLLLNSFSFIHMCEKLWKIHFDFFLVVFWYFFFIFYPPIQKINKIKTRKIFVAAIFSFITFDNFFSVQKHKQVKSNFVLFQCLVGLELKRYHLRT